MSKIDRKGQVPGLLDGIPKTLKIETIVANGEISDRQDQRRRQRRGGPLNLGALVDDPSSALPGQDVEPRNKAERAAAAFKASYFRGDTTPSKVDLTKDDLPGFMRLEVNEIQSYEGNPRIFVNERRDEIRQSLKGQGFTGSMTVTRRGKGHPYILAAGSNTTLQLLQELFAETGDERYRYVNCVFQDFVDDTKLLAQHLGENVNRGDMKFWEVAKGMLKVAKEVEEKQIAAGERSKPMSSRDIADALTSLGLKADRSVVQGWQFAVERLEALGDHAGLLGSKGVRTVVQPRLNALRSLASLFGISDAEYWDDVVPAALRRVSQSISIQEGEPSLDHAFIPDTVQSLLADRVGETTTSLRDMLAGLARNPSASLSDLRAPDPSILLGRNGSESGNHQVAHEDPPEPGAAKQTPLALGPTVIRNQASAPASTPSQTRSPSPSAGDQVHSSSPTATGLGPEPTKAPVQHTLAMTVPAVSADPLPELHAALQELVREAHIEDLLVWCKTMPLGFFLELPVAGKHRTRVASFDSPEDHLRESRRYVWWTLSRLAGQWTEACPEFIDQSSRFYTVHAALTEDSPSAFLDTDMVEDVGEGIQALMRRVSPGPHRMALHKLRVVESLMAEVYEAHPHRWEQMQRMQASNSPY